MRRKGCKISNKQSVGQCVRVISLAWICQVQSFCKLGEILHRKIDHFGKFHRNFDVSGLTFLTKLSKTYINPFEQLCCIFEKKV